MSIRKEDLYKLIELFDENDTKLAYDLIQGVIEKDNKEELIVEADNSPLTVNEKNILEQAEIDIKNNDLVDWDKINEV